MKQTKAWDSITKYLFPIILVLFPLRHVHVGIDFWDTGYNYANFRFFGMEHMDPMWLFSTYLANFTGHLMTYLPGGKTLIGLNIYTGLVVSVLALVAYFFLTKECKLKKNLVFLGEILALCMCSCPTALLYNYLTYLFLMLSVIFLYKGLLYEQKRKLYFAGICLGINVFVRFPDIVETALIVGVWAYAIICRKKFAEVVKETGICIAGFLSSGLLILGILSARYGFKNYVEGIKRLFAMTEVASGYKPKSMIFTALESYVDMLYWVIRLGIIGLLAYGLFLLIPKKYDKIRKAATVPVLAFALYFMISRHLAIQDFTEYAAVFRPGVLLLILANAICLIQVFRKNTTKEERLLGGLIFLVIMITPIGSNTGLYAILSNLFLVLPYVLCMVGQFVAYRWEKAVLPNHSISLFPMQAFLVSYLLYFTYFAAGFGLTFVFAEATGIKEVGAKIENNSVLQGVTMSRERADALKEATAFIADNQLTEREMITYGYVPALHFYLDMAPAFNAWCDLLSYKSYVMEERLQDVEKGLTKENGPIIILDKKHALYLNGSDYVILDAGYTQKEVEELKADEKFSLLIGFMERNSYREECETSLFAIYRSDR